MYRIISILLILSFVLYQSCEEEWVNYCVEMDRQEGPVPYKSFAEITNDSINCWLPITDTVPYYEPLLYRIDDQATFDSLVLCDCDDLEVNFEEYTLLIGHFFVHHGPATIREKRVNLYCGFEEQGLGYRILVDIPEKIPDSGTLIQHNIFVPKLPKDLPIGHSIDHVKLYASEAQSK